MAKFKAGDIVYHKATEQKGVITSVTPHAGQIKYGITWDDGRELLHAESELFSEKEYEEHNKPMTM